MQGNGRIENRNSGTPKFSFKHGVARTNFDCPDMQKAAEKGEPFTVTVKLVWIEQDPVHKCVLRFLPLGKLHPATNGQCGECPTVFLVSRFFVPTARLF